MKKVSMATIAQALNVSTVTVHKALKNRSGVSPALRQKILDLADELGYERPQQSTGVLNFVHLISKDFLVSASEQYYTVIYYYLSRLCAETGAKLHFIVHDTLSATRANLKGLLQETDINGIFVAGQIEPALLSEIESMKLPVVCIDFYSSDHPFNYIYIDNYNAGYALTKYLIKRGHRRIGFIGDIKFSDSVADRYFGYLRALNRYNIAKSYHINSNIERSFAETMQLDENPSRYMADFDLGLDEMPTAFICHCDRAASVLYAKLKQSGLRVPEDVSVISFDNTDICQVLSPPLSSMGTDKQIVAEQAFRLMQQAVKKVGGLDLNYVKLNQTLFERASVADLNVPEGDEENK